MNLHFNDTVRFKHYFLYSSRTSVLSPYKSGKPFVIAACLMLKWQKFYWRCFLESLDLAHSLVDTILDKKGSDIVLLDIQDQAVFASHFLICNGENDRQLRALADSVTEKAKQEAQLLPLGVEGRPDTGWILVDFGDLVVHLFSPEKRTYYALETLWQDAYTVLRLQ